MKRWLVVSIALAGIAFSQGIEEKGAKLGFSITNLRGKDVKKPKSKVGYVVGGFLNIRVNEQIVLQPELLFATKGGEREITSVGSPSTTTTTEKRTESLNYIEIPVLTKFSIPSKSNIKPFILGGPSVGILLSAKSKNGAEKDIKKYRKSTDIGLVLGGGIEFPVQRYKGIAEIRYTLGLASIDKPEAGKTKADIKNGAISIVASVPF